MSLSERNIKELCKLQSNVRLLEKQILNCRIQVTQCKLLNFLFVNNYIFQSLHLSSTSQ